MVHFDSKYITVDSDGVERNIEKFTNNQVVLVTDKQSSMWDLLEIIERFEKDKRTFAVLGMGKKSYMLVREIEPDSTYKSPVTGKDVVYSDYVDIFGKMRHIIGECEPESCLVKFYDKGKEVYFDVDYCVE